MKLKVIAPFSWAHRHVDIKEYAVGDVIETEDQDLIDVSLREGWTADPDAPVDAAPTKRAKAAAPENKDAGAAPENA